jgi:hypothetical protein
MLTCAIHRAAAGASTCSSPPVSASPCWSLGGGKSGSVASASGAGSVGVDPQGLMARGLEQLWLALRLKTLLGLTTRGLR